MEVKKLVAYYPSKSIINHFEPGVQCVHFNFFDPSTCEKTSMSRARKAMSLIDPQWNSKYTIFFPFSPADLEYARIVDTEKSPILCVPPDQWGTITHSPLDHSLFPAVYHRRIKLIPLKSFSS